MDVNVHPLKDGTALFQSGGHVPSAVPGHSEYPAGRRSGSRKYIWRKTRRQQSRNQRLPAVRLPRSLLKQKGKSCWQRRRRFTDPDRGKSPEEQKKKMVSSSEPAPVVPAAAPEEEPIKKEEAPQRVSWRRPSGAAGTVPGKAADGHRKAFSPDSGTDF